MYNTPAVQWQHMGASATLTLFSSGGRPGNEASFIPDHPTNMHKKPSYYEVMLLQSQAILEANACLT